MRRTRTSLLRQVTELSHILVKRGRSTFRTPAAVTNLGKVVVLLSVVVTLAGCRSETSASAGSQGPTASQSSGSHPYVGMWVTADNHIRQELLADGRYDEARGQRASAYTGRYEVTGEHIEYWDDSGFTADGRFEGDVLHHGGYLFYREGSSAHRQATR